MTTLADLKPDPKNARKRGPRAEGLLVSSLQEVGAARSIVIDEDNNILAGNGTVQAAAEAGIERVHVVDADGETIVAVRRTGLTESQKKRLAVLDNRTGELAEWDAGILAELSGEIDLTDLWNPQEIEDLLRDVTPVTLQTDPDEIPESVATRCKLGDLWKLGDHRLLCGDSTKREDVERLMGGAKASLMLTDPPYGIGGSGMTMGSGQSSKPREKRLSYGQTWDDARPDITPFLAYAEWQCVWGGNYFSDVLPPTNHWLCWHKKNDGLTFSEFELAWTNYGRQARHIAHHWGGEQKEHITQKPFDVMVFSLDQCPDASLVLDPFLGSGTTLIAAEQLGRKCYGMEIEPKYCDVILQRWENATGKKAELIKPRKPYDSTPRKVLTDKTSRTTIKSNGTEKRNSETPAGV